MRTLAAAVIMLACIVALCVGMMIRNHRRATAYERQSRSKRPD